MGRACSAYGEFEMSTQFWFRNVKGGDHLEDLGVDGMRIILNWILGN
jgi:hypothetical protein